jgi:hypothetical protein
MKQVLGTQRPHQRILHQIVGNIAVASERARIAPQRRNRRLDILAEPAHPRTPCTAPLPDKRCFRAKQHQGAATYSIFPIPPTKHKAVCLLAPLPYAIRGRRRQPVEDEQAWRKPQV